MTKKPETLEDYLAKSTEFPHFLDGPNTVFAYRIAKATIDKILDDAWQQDEQDYIGGDVGFCEGYNACRDDIKKSAVEWLGEKI